MTKSREAIGLKLALLIGCLCLGCAAFGVLVWRMVDRIKANGPLYTQIIVGKDVVAGILPPPEYIIESYLTPMLLADAGTANSLKGDRERCPYAEMVAYSTRQCLTDRLEGF